MPKYRVLIHQNLVLSTIVEAESEEEAKQKAEEAYSEGDELDHYWSEMSFSEIDNSYQGGN